MLREYVMRIHSADTTFEDTVKASSAGEAYKIMEARYGAGSVAGILSERLL